MSSPILIVHGGAWTIPGDMVDGTKRGIQDALRAGYAVLKSGGTAVDGVEAAIMSLENDPNFEAGYGSALTSGGTIEMDSMIMDGKTMKAGSVGCVSCFRNPIKLAKLVMEETDHVLLVGEGANNFAQEMGVIPVDQDSLISPHARSAWDNFRQSGIRGYGGSVTTGFGRRGHDTVGAVAVDSMGNIASGTSTGGITGKRPGRVGDTPLVGCGGYADNEVGGVSSTGHGEGIIKVCLARHVIFLMEQGKKSDDPNSPDYVPSVNMGGYMTHKTSGELRMARLERQQRRQTDKEKEEVPKANVLLDLTENMPPESEPEPKQGLSAQEASKKAVENMYSKVGSCGGVIVISKKGDIGQYFTTDNMARGWIKDGQMKWCVAMDDIQSAPAI